tara:strand:+ start:85 stop:297 length:213 start_codon:yes stop_codon:yes gene_type:complete
MIWSHHQKFVVVDNAVAFVGGIDLAYGRYDTHNHAICDYEEPQLYPGADFVNPQIPGCGRSDKVSYLPIN